MRIGILCGTFDPIHLGHIGLAEEAIKSYNIDMVILVPANNPPHKENITPFNVRYTMTLISCMHIPNIFCSTLEYEEKVIYTIDTLRAFKEKYPKDDICLIVGSDTMDKISTWNRSEILMKEFEIISIDRGTVTMDISSTDVRKVVKGMHPGVLAYIAQNKLYK